MSDERLLSEALRAHAAGGVSTPRADTSAPPAGSPAADAASDAPSSGRRRFRPLGRVRQPEQPTSDRTSGQPGPEQPPTEQTPVGRTRGALPVDQPRTDQHAPDRAPRPDVPSPRSGGPGLPPPGYARGPMPAAPPTAPVRPSGFGGAVGAGRGQGPAGRPGSPRPVPPAGTSAGYVPWSAVTVTWWSLVAVLAGGVVGGAIGVLSLLLPA
jgi:hypothetical protein